LSSWLREKSLLDVIDVLDLVSFINLGEGDLDSVEFSAVDAHSSESSPESAFIDESAQSNHSFEIELFNVLVKHARVGRNWESCESTIKSSNSANVSRETDHTGKFANIVSFTALHGFSHEVSVNVDGVGVEPCDLLSVSEGCDHVILVIPLETIDHIADFVQLGSVDLGHEHVSVVVYEHHFAFGRDINLVKFHLNDVSSMVNGLASFAGVNVEDFDLLGVDGVDDCDNI
jgi:hypothetical protein